MEITLALGSFAVLVGVWSVGGYAQETTRITKLNPAVRGEEGLLGDFALQVQKEVAH